MTRKALAIKQPWASLIIDGRKPIENRTWNTHYRGTLHVHASKRWKVHDCEVIWQRHGIRIDPSTLLLGGIIGTVELYDVVTHDASLWFVGPFGWKLRNPRPLPFMPLTGRQNIFTF